ncbi:MAG: N-acetyltransferase [Rhodocyclales bacterium]|nr:N-acetyltransferase [Rhodocyclales bacterium]
MTVEERGFSLHANSMNTIQLRQANDDDREFLFESYKATLQPCVEWAWGWNEEFQRTGFCKHHPHEQLRVITVDGKKAGGIHVEEQETLNVLRLIFLLPTFQNRGIGSELILSEVTRARQAGKQFYLKVIRINPAKKLYDRLGFVVINEDDATYHMRHDLKD